MKAPCIVPSGGTLGKLQLMKPKPLTSSVKMGDCVVRPLTDYIHGIESWKMYEARF